MIKLLFKRIGLPLIFLGVIILIIYTLLGLCNNILLILSILFIIAGIILYVLALKKESKY